MDSTWMPAGWNQNKALMGVKHLNCFNNMYMLTYEISLNEWNYKYVSNKLLGQWTLY